MAVVTRLVTVVDVDDRAVASDAPDGSAASGSPSGWAPAPADRRPPEPNEISVSALHAAGLDDGRRLTLLDDRGWTESGPGDPWLAASAESVAAQARTVVGPDEPGAGPSSEDESRAHWEHLATVLEQQGVHVPARDLGRLPHEVELTDRLRRRLAGGGEAPRPAP